MRRKSKSAQQFIFLELLDPEINGLLCRLRAAFSDEKAFTNIHITVRGPYRNMISEEEIKKYRELLSDEPILIHGINMFKNPGRYVVYIGVSCERLKQIWWKPDYPAKTFGFNPHISLYVGSDQLLAEKIQYFLKKEGLKLLCRDFRLTPYTSRQTEMFPLDPAPVERLFLALSNRRLVRADIVQRAENIVSSHRTTMIRREAP